MVKTCSKCKTQKSITEFSKCAKNKCGLSGRCKQCSSNYYNDRKEHYKKLHSVYYSNNKDAVNNYKNNWEKSNYTERRKAVEKNQREGLSDGYIKAKLRRRGFENKDIVDAPELVEAIRQIIKIKRYVKEKTGKKHTRA